MRTVIHLLHRLVALVLCVPAVLSTLCQHLDRHEGFPHLLFTASLALCIYRVLFDP